MPEYVFKVMHGFCGAGLGAMGFKQSRPRAGLSTGQYRTLGGFDSDPGACRNFELLTGVRATQLDFFERWAYEAYHGHPPPSGWREVTLDDIRQAAGHEFPDVLFLSPPCVGFSGLVGGQKSKAPKYQALNSLVARGIFHCLEAWADDPPSFVLLENVPLIQTRGAELLEDVEKVLRAYGYAVAHTTHDCGVIGSLAQHRERFLLVARHMAKVPAHLHEPPARRVRAVCEVLDDLPIPGLGIGGPMHELPKLELLTLLRLACVYPGKDWKWLNKLPFDGIRLEPARSFNGDTYGVTPWKGSAAAVTGSAQTSRGRFAVQDIRAGLGEKTPAFNNVLQVIPYLGSASAITAGGTPTAGGQSFADQRVLRQDVLFSNLGRVESPGGPAHAVVGATRPAGGALSYADDRVFDLAEIAPSTSWDGKGKYRVTARDEAAGAVIGESSTGNGAFAFQEVRLEKSAVGSRYDTLGVIPHDGAAGAVSAASEVGGGRYAWQDRRVVPDGEVSAEELADVQMGQHSGKLRVEDWLGSAHAVQTNDRVGSGALSVSDLRFTAKSEDGQFLTAGHLGVRPWQGTSGAVVGNAKHDRGTWSVADPRTWKLTDRISPMPILLSPYGTGWHRPFTTLELGVLQGLPALAEDGGWLVLDGGAHTHWRKYIGNGVPLGASQAIGDVIGRTLILVAEGRSFTLSSEPVWVDPGGVHMNELLFAITVAM